MHQQQHVQAHLTCPSTPSRAVVVHDVPPEDRARTLLRVHARAKGREGGMEGERDGWMDGGRDGWMDGGREGGME